MNRVREEIPRMHLSALVNSEFILSFLFVEIPVKFEISPHTHTRNPYNVRNVQEKTTKKCVPKSVLEFCANEMPHPCF